MIECNTNPLCSLNKKMNKFLRIVTLTLILNIFEFVAKGDEIEDYLKTVSIYYQKRNVKILTHLSCFSAAENARISVELSKQNQQSRFITVFDEMQSVFGTPINNTIQGFVVNMKCPQFVDIFYEQRITYRDYNLWLFIDDSIEASNINETIVSKVIKHTI